MAYIDTDTVKKIRNALKAEFPNTKFSVRRSASCALHVSVMKSSLFEDGVSQPVNHYWLDDMEDQNKREFLKKVDETIRVVGDYFDKSDSMTDYFHCAFYYDIEIGKWDKPHVKVGV